MGQRRLHVRRGLSASFAPSPAPLARGRGGAAAAGVPGVPGRPSLHRNSPCAHWPRRGDHPRRRPGRAPPREPWKGRREAAPPRTVQPPDGVWRPAAATRPAPRRRCESRVSPNRPCKVGAECWGGGRGPEGKGAAASLSARSRGSIALEGWSLATAYPCPARPRGAGLHRIGKPSHPGYFPQPEGLGR